MYHFYFIHHLHSRSMQLSTVKKNNPTITNDALKDNFYFFSVYMCVLEERVKE